MDITLELMKHSILEGERILLRPVGFADAPDMFAYASDEETTRFVFEMHRNQAMTEEAIANYFMAAPAGKYAIVVKDTQKDDRDDRYPSEPDRPHCGNRLYA